MTTEILACDKIHENRGYEPPKNGKLLDLKSVIAAPHIGAQAQKPQLRSSNLLAAKVTETFEKGSG